MNELVDRLALPIVGFPKEAVALAKAEVLDAEPTSEAGLVKEAYRFQLTVRNEGARRTVRLALEAIAAGFAVRQIDCGDGHMSWRCLHGGLAGLPAGLPHEG